METKVRVMVLGLNYLPESTSIGPYTAGLAEHLARIGHDVEVLTGFPMAPQWRVWDGYRGRWFLRERINGIKITRCYLFVPRDPRHALGRAAFDTSFFASALIAGLAMRRCDVIIAVSPPLQVGLTAWVLGRMWRANVLLHVQDLVPDAAVATGLMKENSLAVRLARRLEQFVYRRATEIGVISEGFRRSMERQGVPPEKIRLLPNSIDLDFIRPESKVNGFRQRHGLAADAVVVMYSGSVGMKQGLETLMDAAALIRADSRILLVIVGEGPPLNELKARASRDRLRNVLFLPLQPRETLSEQLAAADILVITQRRAVTDIVFPGKLLYYMAAGRPIVAAVSEDSETGRFIRDHKVGVVTPPEEATPLAAALMGMTADDAEVMGRLGRAVVERLFDQRVVLPAFQAEIEHLCHGRGDAEDGA